MTKCVIKRENYLRYLRIILTSISSGYNYSMPSNVDAYGLRRAIIDIDALVLH